MARGVEAAGVDGGGVVRGGGMPGRGDGLGCELKRGRCPRLGGLPGGGIADRDRLHRPGPEVPGPQAGDDRREVLV